VVAVVPQAKASASKVASPLAGLPPGLAAKAVPGGKPQPDPPGKANGHG
jgi:hypothetical protein